ncbi:MAG: hypothetical protein NZ942_03730 [Candidatus Aenigmarchaeota archaeon]|nr:hypothetical protein [Candidatus Aenigmarchaeota archaeon]
MNLKLFGLLVLISSLLIVPIALSAIVEITIEYEEVCVINGTCDIGETCSNCADCPCPGSPGCCGSSCGCPEGQVCQNNVCITPTQPQPPGGGPSCDPSRDISCCIQKYGQCCDCADLGYSNCYILPFNKIYNDCKDQCMHACPGGCSQFNNYSSCLNAGCKWYNNACYETFTGSCSQLTDQESCINVGCEWCEGVCKDECKLNWNLTISRYLETFVNAEINASVEIKNIGDKSVTNVRVNVINISQTIEYKLSPSSYSRILPGETKSFIITLNPKEVGNYEIKINITSNEVFHVSEINLIVKEPLTWHPELLTMIILLWIIAGLIIMLTFVSYKLYMRRKMKKLKVVEKS